MIGPFVNTFGVHGELTVIGPSHKGLLTSPEYLRGHPRNKKCVFDGIFREPYVA